MTTDKPIHILARLEVGFRTDATHLKELEQDLAVTLLSARQFGRKAWFTGRLDDELGPTMG